jgi:hypothetical protein
MVIRAWIGPRKLRLGGRLSGRPIDGVVSGEIKRRMMLDGLTGFADNFHLVGGEVSPVEEDLRTKEVISNHSSSHHPGNKVKCRAFLDRFPGCTAQKGEE